MPASWAQLALLHERGSARTRHERNTFIKCAELGRRGETEEGKNGEV